MKRKFTLLFSLFMAIVMIVLSPQKVWADSDPRLSALSLTGVTATISDVDYYSSTATSYPWVVIDDSVLDDGAYPKGKPGLMSSSKDVHSSTSCIIITLTSASEFNVEFTYWASSEGGSWDFLYVGNKANDAVWTQLGNIGGTACASYYYQETFEAGTYSFAFQYRKDGSVSSGYDRGFVYDFSAAVTCDHDWSAWTEATAATCTAHADSTRTCSLCGAVEHKEGAILSHNWSAWTEATAATCTTYADSTRTCSLCQGVEHKASTSMLPHSLLAVSETAATCEGAGYHAHQYCTSCWGHFDEEGNTLSKSDYYIEPLAHNKDYEWDYLAPTCTEEGHEAHYHCSICNQYYNTSDVKIAVDSWIIPATGHDTTHVAALAPTCTEIGNNEYWYCKNTHEYFKDAACTQLYKDTFDTGSNGGLWIAMVPHNYEGAFDASGAQYCSVCGHAHGEAPAHIEDAASPYYNYYAISKPGHMVWLRENATDSTVVNAYLVNDINLAPICHAGDSVNNVNAINWEPIHLYGTFDGCNHTISNLYYSSEESNSGVGLFANKTRGFSVKNLTVSGEINAPESRDVGLIAGVMIADHTCVLDNLHTSGSVVAQANAGAVAGTVGHISGATPMMVSRCSNEATVSGQQALGGLVGVGFVSIDSCSNSAKITSTTTDDSSYAGGLIGQQLSGSVNNLLTLHASHNSGEISGTAACVGGLAGMAFAVIDTCYNTGKVTGEGNYVGGIAGTLVPGAGELVGPVKHCSNTGFIAGAGRVGGLFGLHSSACLDSLYNYGNVMGTGEYIGGIFGDQNSIGKSSGSHTLYHCYNYGTVSAPNSRYVGGIAGSTCAVVQYCYNTKAVTGACFVGGIAGYSVSPSGSSVPYCGSCSNSGEISGTSSNGGNVGGIVGQHAFYTIANCTNSGNIHSNSSNVGGIFGQQYTQLQNNSSLHNSQVFLCSNTGNVEGAEYIGGIGGLMAARVDSCYNTGAVVRAFGNYAGGITGAQVTPNGSMLSNYTHCSNSARVTAGGQFAGGISGMTTTSNLMYNTNSGIVRSNGGYAGGIVGKAGQASGNLSPIRYCINTGDSVSTYSGSFTGGIAGFNQGDVFQCQNSAIVVNSSGAQYTAGIVGQNTTVNSSMNTISYCRNTGDVISGGGNTGGIAGYSQASLDSLYNSGNILTTSGQGYIGGIAGYASHCGGYAHLTRCVNEGDSVTSWGGYTAGIAGRQDANIIDCHNKAHVISLGGAGYVGGIVGQNDTYSGMNKIKNCSSIGDVKSNGGYVGGIAGLSKATCDSLYHHGSVFSYTTTGYVGGIVGQALQPGAHSTFNYCVNEGDSVYSQGGGRVGGITGYNQGDISHCHNTAHVYTTGGAGYVGGIVGQNSCYRGLNAISYCSSTGDVYNGGGNGYVGGIAGFAVATFDSIYHHGNVFSLTTSSYVGGIAGQCDQTFSAYMHFTRCVNEGDSVYSRSGFVGGIAGGNRGNFHDCHNTAHVYTTGSAGFVGGIVGQNSIYSGMNSFKNCSSIGDVYNGPANGYVGGIAGQAAATYDSIYHRGNVVSYSTVGYVGGLVGHANDCGKDSHFTHCINEGDSVYSKGVYVGGLVGYQGSGSFIHCHNVADVTTTAKAYIDYYDRNSSFAGGLVGYSSTKGHMCVIDTCYSIGNVTAPGSYVGGIAGYAYATYDSLYHQGNVLSTDTGAYVGGLVGQAYQCSADVPFVRCVNVGDSVRANGLYVGGLVGYTDGGNLIHCHNTAAITNTGKGYDLGYYDASFAGGLVGYSGSRGGSSSPYVVDSCSNTGNVTAAGGCAGGIAGVIHAHTLDSIYNSGNVLSTDTGWYVGGLAGKLYHAGYTSDLSHCYNTGSSVTANGLYVGGLTGYSNGGDLINCHNTAAVTTTGKGYVSDDYPYSYDASFAGGLVGYSGSYNGSYSPYVVDSCSNTGNITAAGGYAGGIAGRIYAHTLDSVYNSGIVLSTDTGWYVGGLVGMLYQAGYTSDLSHCSNTGSSVTANGLYVGGLVGYFDGGDVRHCHNTAAITTTAKSSYSDSWSSFYDASYAGGIVGCGGSYYANPYVVDSCSNTGNVTAAGGYAGGIVGMISAHTLDSLYNSGNVLSTDTGWYVGGLVGKIYTCGWNSHLTRCYNTGDSVKANGLYVGGIVGFNEGDLRHCHNTAAVTTTAKGYVQGYYEASFAGGLAGDNYSTGGYSNRIDSCSNTGNVTAAGGVAGGIAGRAIPQQMDSLYNSGIVLSTDTGSYVGGLVGLVDCFNGKRTSMRNCYNVATVTAKGQYVGGLAGYYTGGDMSLCHNTAAVTSAFVDRSSHAYVGGLTGYSYNYTGELCRIDSCSNTGNITAYSGSVGGLVGNGYPTLYHSFNSGDITIPLGLVEYVGGLVGGAYRVSEVPSITTCYNTGDISVSSRGHLVKVGGLAGYLESAQATNSYNAGAMNLSAGSPASNTNVGALIGYINNAGQDVINIDLYMPVQDTLTAWGGISNYDANRVKIHQMTEAQFESGEVAWLLNGKSSVDPVWGQLIGTDKTPNFNNGVDYLVNCEDGLFYNSNAAATYELVDGTNYTNATPLEVATLTYKRSFSEAQVGNWQALYVPFPLDVDACASYFDVAAINNFHEYTDATGATVQIDLEVRIITNGTLRANYPYLIRPKQQADAAIDFYNVHLYPAQSNSISCASMATKYTFTGIYEAEQGLKTKDYVFLAGGYMCKATDDDVVLKAQRWYLKADNLDPQWNAGNGTAPISIRVVGEGDETTGLNELVGTSSASSRVNGSWAPGIYDVTGRLVPEVTMGVFIIVHEDGTVEKVIGK